MRPRILAAAAVAAAFAGTSLAQQAPQPPSKAPPAQPPKAAASASQGKDALKGKLKPGLYEMVVESDMTNMPGFPKDKAKQTEKRQQCVTQKEIDAGIENDPNCPMTAFAASGNTVNTSATCKDGASLESKMTFNSSGYVAEMKVSGKQGTQAFGATHKMTARYIGPCKEQAPAK